MLAKRLFLRNVFYDILSLTVKPPLIHFSKDWYENKQYYNPVVSAYPVMLQEKF